MSELREGDVVASRYRVVRELARGGMGVVYEATDLKFALQVALKVIGGPGTDTAAMRARFVREARLGALLGRTPGFVRVFDWGEREDEVYLAMDLVAGAQELDLSSGALPERLERFTAAARIVSTLHRLGVIHRDLKPSNFLVGRDGEMRLTDFGIAKALGEPDEEVAPRTSDMDLTSTGTTMGTPHYMAPELFEDAKAADARADVYALGVMLFFALTGRMPYEGDNPATVITAQMHVRFRQREAPRPRDLVAVPVALDQVCARATALEAAQRHADAGALLEALERTEWRKALAAPRPGGRRPSSPDAPTLVEAGEEPRAPGGRERCPACGADDALRGERCVRCGAARGERPASARVARAPSAPPPAQADPVRLRSEVGAGLDPGGPPLPRGALFVAGALLVIALGVYALPPARRAPPAPERLSAAELPPEHRRQLALFERVHAGWLERAEAPLDGGAERALDPWELAGAEAAAEVRATFLALSCTRDPASGSPCTRAGTAEYTFERVGHGPVLIVRRPDAGG